MQMRFQRSPPRVGTFIRGLSLAVAVFCAGCGSTGPDVTPPDTPRGFAYDRNRSGDGEISFVWERNREKDLAGYRLYRVQDDPAHEFALIATVHRDSASYTDSNLDYTITFYYRLTAFDQSDNESAPTSPVLAIAANLTAPATPSNVHATAQNLRPPPSITLSWSPNREGDLKEYRVFRGTSGVSTDGTALAVIPNGTATYEDTAISVGTRYFYRVVAVDKGDLKSPGSQSEEVSDTALRQPTLISPAANATAGSATPEFRWDLVSQAVGYKLYVTTDAVGRDVYWSRYVDALTASITYSGPVLTSGRAYYWQVAATTKGESPINSISELRKFTAR